MVRTAITPTVGGNGYTPAASAPVMTMAAGDVPNGNDVVLSGRDIIVARNSHATLPYTITLGSKADPYGRTGDIVKSLAAGELWLYPIPNPTGWSDPTTSKMNINVENAAVLVGVLRLP